MVEKLFSKYNFGVKLTLSMSMHCACQVAMAITKNKNFNGKNRHIRLRHNVIKQLQVISIDYVKSEVNLADPLTKPLGRKLIDETSRGMGLYSI